MASTWRLSRGKSEVRRFSLHRLAINYSRCPTMVYSYTKNIKIVLFMCKKLSAFFCSYFTVKPEIPFYQLVLVNPLNPLSTVDKINITQ
jgi:hypothetical protein